MAPLFDTDAPEPERFLAEFSGKTLNAVYIDDTDPEFPAIVVSAEGGRMLRVLVDEDGDLAFAVEDVN